jgi:proline iminopeptidase
MPTSPETFSTLRAPDGTLLGYRVIGDNTRVDATPVVCIPGGPADSSYLGDLGGLSRYRPLILLDLRGTGRSAIPEDTSSYRCDRLVGDVEALREHLGLDRVDLLGHSAGTNVATQYAARYPKQVNKLVLVGPSTRAVGLEIPGQTRAELAQTRRDEPWFPAASAALAEIIAGTSDDRDAIAPFFYGSWDTVACEHYAASQPRNPEAVAGFGADGAFNPQATRDALATMAAPVLLLAGEHDLNSPPSSAAEFATLWPDATLVVQPGAGHYPWLDDADQFVATLAEFLGR